MGICHPFRFTIPGISLRIFGTFQNAADHGDQRQQDDDAKHDDEVFHNTGTIFCFFVLFRAGKELAVRNAGRRVRVANHMRSDVKAIGTPINRASNNEIVMIGEFCMTK
jgi:hypothetical protein